MKGLVFQLLLALEHLHSRRIAHCDLKLDNVLVTEGGLLKLADFGYARYCPPAVGRRWYTVARVCAEMYRY